MTFKQINRIKAQQNGKVAGFNGKSKLEVALIKQLESTGKAFEYEKSKLPYIKQHRYIPDFILIEQAIIVEAKGVFFSEDRSKMRAIKKAYPQLDIRILFQNENVKISKKSSMTYRDWCNKNGFICASGYIPESWLNHNPSKEQIQAFEEVFYKKD